MSRSLASAKRLVVKIGSALLVEQDAGTLKRAWLEALADDVAALKAEGVEVVLVSSGAIALGRRHLKLPPGALALEQKQAAAATGQIRLAHAWQEALARHGITCAQILVTLEDTEERRRYLNARATIATLLALGAVPVINENDTVATSEIRFGDNDRLAARVAQMISADTLVLLSDIDGLYTADPRTDTKATHIGEVGRITYTQWLNDIGTLEADLTVTRLAEDRFWVVASDTAHRHALTWLRRHVQPGEIVHIADQTGAWAQINIQGPRSRELLQTLTSADLSNAAFPFRAARTIDIGYALVLCVRITYLGELGYELYVPAEQAVHVYDELVAAGEAFGLRHAGLKALASLRMEKGYRDYGHDIDNTDNAYEAGLGFAVDLVAPRAFIGRAVAQQQKAAGVPHRRLLQVQLLEPDALLFHAEVVWRDGVRVGYVRAASYGWTLGGAVGLAMIEALQPLTQAWIDAGSWVVEVAERRVPAKLSLRPLFDPTNEKIKG